MAAGLTGSFVDTRRIGDARVTLISEGVLPYALELQAPEAAWRRAMPEADAAGRVPLGLQVILIELGTTTLLIDPGFDDPGHPSDWDQEGLSRSPGLIAGLAAIGARPDDITHVAITHAHSDHYAGIVTEQDGRRVARFPRARHLLGRADWAAYPDHEDPHSIFRRHVGLIAELGLLDLVDGDHEVAPGITLLHTPGESPGHQVVRLHSVGAAFYALGDLFHHACEIEHLDWRSPGRDAAAMLQARRRILRMAAAEDAALVFTHEPFPGWGRVEQIGGGYRWRRG